MTYSFFNHGFFTSFYLDVLHELIINWVNLNNGWTIKKSASDLATLNRESTNAIRMSAIATENGTTDRELGACAQQTPPHTRNMAKIQAQTADYDLTTACKFTGILYSPVFALWYKAYLLSRLNFYCTYVRPWMFVFITRSVRAHRYFMCNESRKLFFVRPTKTYVLPIKSGSQQAKKAIFW